MRYRVHLVILLLPFTSVVPAAADDELEALIAEVERQEAHYSELEYVATTTFLISEDHPANADLTTDAMLTEECRAEYAIRDRRWRFHVEGTSHYLLRDERWTCEGVWTGAEEYLLFEVVETEVVSGEEIERRNRGLILAVPRAHTWPTDFGGGRFIHPHMAWSHNLPGPPLSAFLRGRNALAASLGSDPSFNTAVEDLGDSEWEGLRSRLLRVNFIPLDGGNASSVTLWLAYERNLIPVHADSSSGIGDDAITDRNSTITEWHEVTEGVYFPRRLQDDEFDSSTASPDERQLPVSQREWVVESVSTSSNRPDSDFESLEFPEGVEVVRP